MSSLDQYKIPVTILTGFLGSGKTTLLNHILNGDHGKKYAVIENEFGEVGVDDELVTKRQKFSSEEEVIEMMNGCICCTVRADLIEVLKKIIKMSRKFDGILIETTGLADPAPVAQTFFVDEYVSEKLRLDGIITVVDAKHIIQHLDAVKAEGVENESVEQLAFADKILFNKLDLVPDEAERDQIKARIRAINSGAEIIECEQSRVDPTLLLNINSFSLDRVLEFDAGFLDTDGEHKHDDSVTSVGFRHFDPVNVGRLEDWIGSLIRSKANDLLRYKGVINVMGMNKRFVFQGVHMIFNGSFTTEWDEDEIRESKFIFIGKDLDRVALTEGFLNCNASLTPLRFAVGTRVKAFVGKNLYEEDSRADEDGFAAGTIIKQWDEGNPYRITLDDGIDVWGPDDKDAFVCLLK